MVDSVTSKVVTNVQVSVIVIPKDRIYHRIDYLKNKTKVSLGGRSAEVIILGKDKISTGAHGDISQSTDIALKTITKYGIGETLLMSYMRKL
jgi:cell division protease FtsH